MHFNIKLTLALFILMGVCAPAIADNSGNNSVTRNQNPITKNDQKKTKQAISDAENNMDDVLKANPMPSESSIEKIREKNHADTLRAINQAQMAPVNTQINIEIAPNNKGVDIDALVNNYYNKNRDAFDPGAVAEKRNLQQGILYFASLSMPAAALVRVIDQLAKINGSIVLRGLIKPGDMKGTADAIAKLIGNRPVSFLIDPNLFKRFDVKQVPTLVVLPGKQVPTCQNNTCDEPTPLYYAITGDVSVDYALDSITKMAPHAEGSIQPYLAKLRGGNATR